MSERILPAEYALNGIKPLLENIRIEYRLTAPLRLFPASGIRVDIRFHAAIKYRFAIPATIVDAV